MQPMFTVPPPGSPLDVARDIMADDDVQSAIEELLSTLEVAAAAKGLTRDEIKQATDSHLNNVRAIIDGAIESGFQHVLSRRNSDA